MKIEPKNHILLLAAVAIILMGVSAFLLDKNRLTESDMNIRKIETVSNSSETGTMEQEINDTDFSDIDSEMNQMELELEGY